MKADTPENGLTARRRISGREFPLVTPDWNSLVLQSVLTRHHLLKIAVRIMEPAGHLVERGGGKLSA
jgi:hypothetical protein